VRNTGQGKGNQGGGANRYNCLSLDEAVTLSLRGGLAPTAGKRWCAERRKKREVAPTPMRNKGPFKEAVAKEKVGRRRNQIF